MVLLRPSRAHVLTVAVLVGLPLTAAACSGTSDEAGTSSSSSGGSSSGDPGTLPDGGALDGSGDGPPTGEGGGPDASADTDVTVTKDATFGASSTIHDLVVDACAKVVLDGGVNISGNLVVKPCGVVTITGKALRIQGDILNDGTVVDLAGIAFTGKSGPNTALQTVTNHDGKGRFMNAPTVGAATATFRGLTIDNVATPVAVKVDLGDGVKVNGAVFIAEHLDFDNGILDIGADNQLVLRAAVTSTRKNGGVLRGFGPGGGGQIAKQFATGASAFTYHLYDNVTPYEYSPVTVSLASNTFAGQVVALTVFDGVHPDMDAGGAPAASISRWWWVIASKVEANTFAGTIELHYLTGDVTGTGAPLHASAWSGSSWVQGPAVASGNTLSVPFSDRTSVGATGRITGRTQ